MYKDHSMEIECAFMRDLYYSNGGCCPPYTQEIENMDK